MISQRNWNKIGVNFYKKLSLSYSKRLTAVANNRDSTKYWTLFIDLCLKLVRAIFLMNLLINLDASKYSRFFLSGT